MAKYDIFISYKRKSLPTANNLYYRLKTRGYSTFFDLEEMGRDNFNVQLLNYIENARDVFVILEEGSLDACERDDWEKDWFCHEIAFALEKKKNIIPILLNGYKMPSVDYFPDKLKELSLKSAPDFNFSFFEDYLNKLIEKEYLLSTPNLQEKATSVFKFYSNENCQVFKEGKLVCSLEGMSDKPYYLPVPRKGDYRFKAVHLITADKQMVKEHIDADEEKEVEIEWGQHENKLQEVNLSEIKTSRRQREEEVKRKAEEETKRREEAKRKAEEEAKRKAEEEAKRKAEEEAKRREEAKRKAEEEAKRREEAKRKAEEEAKRREEAKRKAEEEAKRKEEARRKAEEDLRRQREEKLRKEAEATRQQIDEKKGRITGMAKTLSQGEDDDFAWVMPIPYIAYLLFNILAKFYGGETKDTTEYMFFLPATAMILALIFGILSDFVGNILPEKITGLLDVLSAFFTIITACWGAPFVIYFFPNLAKIIGYLLAFFIIWLWPGCIGMSIVGISQKDANIKVKKLVLPLLLLITLIEVNGALRFYEGNHMCIEFTELRYFVLLIVIAILLYIIILGLGLLSEKTRTIGYRFDFWTITTSILLSLSYVEILLWSLYKCIKGPYIIWWQDLDIL